MSQLESIKEKAVETAANIANTATATDTASGLDELKLMIYISVAFITIVLGGIQFYFNRRHQKNTYTINMLNNTLHAVRQTTLGEVKVMHNELKSDLYKLGYEGALWDPDKTIQTILDLSFGDTDMVGDERKNDIVYRIKSNTYSLLNFYDCLATSIENELIEPAMIFNHYSLMVIDFYRWSKPLIDKEQGDFMPWQPFVFMAKAYIAHQDELKDELDNHKNSIFMKQIVKVK